LPVVVAVLITAPLRAMVAQAGLLPVAAVVAHP
jgi:hypothetical protein